MFTGCTILGRLQKDMGAKGLSGEALEGPAEELVKYVVSTAMDQLRFVVRTSSYRWHLHWATNYTALSVTFAGKTTPLTKFKTGTEICTAVFVLNVARMHEQLVDRAEILDLAEEIAQILQSYPSPHFYRLIRLLISLMTNRPSSPAREDGERLAAQDNDPSTQNSIPRLTGQHLPINSRYMLPAPFPSDLSLEAVLDEHLQDADWMLEPSSITCINFPGEENITLLEQDMSMMRDIRDFGI